jgi:antirestriction protein
MKLRGDAALYCGTYAKYNNGSIDGKWLTLTDYEDAEEFLQACRELHKDEADPEFMFQDFEHFPDELYSESMGREEIQNIYDWVNLDEANDWKTSTCRI